MKKVLIWVSAVTLAMTMAACGGNTDSDDNDKLDPKEQAAALAKKAVNCSDEECWDELMKEYESLIKCFHGKDSILFEETLEKEIMDMYGLSECDDNEVYEVYDEDFGYDWNTMESAVDEAIEALDGYDYGF